MLQNLYILIDKLLKVTDKQAFLRNIAYIYCPMKGIKTAVFGLFLLSFTCLLSGVKIVNFEAAEKEYRKQNDTLYVVNYWATWCKPCVAEMPYFVTASAKFSSKKVKVLFVSLNSLKELNAVEKFAANKKIKQPMFLLHAGNPNVWIDKVDKEWSGSIPATVMYKKNEKVFFKEGEFTQTELDSIINFKIK